MAAASSLVTERKADCECIIGKTLAPSIKTNPISTHTMGCVFRSTHLNPITDYAFLQRIYSIEWMGYMSQLRYTPLFGGTGRLINLLYA